VKPVRPPVRSTFFILSLLAFGATSAQAQTGVAQTGAPQPGAPPQTSPLSPIFGPQLPAAPAGQVSLFLSASFAGDGKPIRSGVVWRVYEDRSDAEQPSVVARSSSAAPNLSLPPGNYLVHAAYGFAGASKRITVHSGSISERLMISAGALKLGGIVSDTPIPPVALSFAIYVPIGSNSEGRLVIPKAQAGQIIRLPEGTYHVVSTYGDANAIMRADLKVETGRVTEATLNHRAATVTLKLVAAEGAEAFAGTAFSVLTPGGDIIREAIDAFPSVTLAEGDYVLIARHEGQVYTREFKVVSGANRDVEIVAASR
jgi:hypothetical protein